MSESNLNQNFSVDITDLCNILQCLGYSITNTKKILKKNENNHKKSIDIVCKTAGIQVTLESSVIDCNCPEIEEQNEIEKWEVSGTSGGKQISKVDTDSVFQRNLSKSVVAHVQNEIKNLSELLHTNKLLLSPLSKKSANLARNPSQKNIESNFTNNFSMSSSCLISPPNMAKQIKISTPSRYRSLDTLNDADYKLDVLPEPKALSGSQKSIIHDSDPNINDKEIQNKNFDNVKSIIRQNTYTASPTDKSRNPHIILPPRTSSPIPVLPSVAMLNLHQAEKITVDLLNIIQETLNAISIKNESNSSLEMNVSKIATTKSQVLHPIVRSESMLSAKTSLPYTSSPNLSYTKSVPRSIGEGSKRRLSYKTSPAVVKSEMKTNSLKRSIPKKLTTIKSSSPTLSISNKKNFGLSSVLGKKILGSYKSLEDKGYSLNAGSSTRSSLRSINQKADKEPEIKKRNNLYDHIKSTIPRQISSAKK